MGKKKNVSIEKLVKLLTGDKKVSQIANVIDRVKVKEFEQVREIVPIEDWIADPYYCGKDCVDKLYPLD